MGKWKKTVAAVAALPVMIAGLALGPVTAMAADNDGGLTDANLVASYDFEDANDKGKDISGNNNDLTVKGENVEYGVPGDHQSGGNAIQLRGNDGQYLELPNGLLNGTDSFTVQFDSKSRMAANDNFFSFTIGSDNQKYFFSRLRPTSVYTAITKASNGNEQGVTATQSANVWHTYRISVSPTFIATFIDGNLAAINKNVTTKLSELGTDLPMNFGKSTWAGDKYYNGGLDNIKIWKAAYASDGMVWDGVTLPGSTEGSVTLPAKDALGNTITWSSSNTAVLGNDGTLVKAPAQDTDVTFTAKSTVNGIEYTKTFTVNVAAAITTADAAAERLLVDYQLTAGATLPTAIAAAPDAKVTWKSSDTSLVKDDGTVVGTNGDAEKTVDLTATVTLGTTSTTKKFTGVRVMPKSAETIASYTRAGSISGGARVGQSLHMALSQDGKSYEALNQNYGVVFAEANYILDEANKALNTTGAEIGRGIADPYLFRMKDGKYAFVSTLTKYNTTRGQDSSSTAYPADPGQILMLTSDDLIQWNDAPNDYEVTGRVKVTDDTTQFDAGSLTAGYDASADNYRVGWTVNGVAKYVTTTDFKTFSEVKTGAAFSKTTADLSGIDNAVTSNTIAVDASLAAKVAEKLGRVTNTGVEGPKDITVEKGADASAIKERITGGQTLENGNLSKGATATATYSDGSTYDFRVNWDADDLAAIDTSKAGTYTVNGTIAQQNFSDGTMMYRRADPNVVYWQGKYYFIATNEGADRNIYIRVADTMEGLKDAGNSVSDGDGGHIVNGQDIFLWGNKDDTGHEGYHWAPELHAITDSNGKTHLYCFFAQYPTGKDGDPSLPGAPNWAGPSAYVYELKDGGDPTKTADWTEHRVLNSTGDALNTKALTIDMTYFEVDGKSYVAWSQGDDTYKGARASLYIAETSKDKPWQITSDATRIVQPVYGWELSGVSEGPNVLVKDGMIYMVFSAQEVSDQYATGMMTAKVGSDLTKASSWTKSNYPWMHNGVFPGQNGLGHNSYFADPYGDIYNVYHFGNSGARNASIVPIHFRTDGSPILDMKVSEELDQSKKNVTLKVVVTEDQVSSDATLKSLNVAGSDIDLDTAASTEGAALEVDDPSKVTDADVKAEVNDANANATVAVANNVVTVTVTAQDGTTVKVYRVVLAKKAVTPDPEGPTDPDSGKDDGDKNTGKDPDKGDKPGADLSETGAAVLGLGGAVVALAVAGISLTIWRKRCA